MARKLLGVAQVHTADLGTRIFYLDHGSFDTHASQTGEHAAAANVVMLIFTEFGRRVHDNGSGTDPGAGAVYVLLRRASGQRKPSG